MSHRNYYRPKGRNALAIGMISAIILIVIVIFLIQYANLPTAAPPPTSAPIPTTTIPPSSSSVPETTIRHHETTATQS